MNVEVYHNVAQDPQGRALGMLDGYSPEHPIVKVAQFPYFDSRDELCAAEYVFRVFNVGDDPEFSDPDSAEMKLAKEYRRRGNRSFSTGDVVSIDGTFYACESHGFSRRYTTPNVVNRKQFGTTPLDDDMPELLVREYLD